MIVLPLFMAFLLLALPGWSRPLGRRTDPRHWARAVTAALIAGLVALEGTLALLAAPTVLRALGAPGLAAMCQRVLETIVPASPITGWAAGAVAALLAGAFGWGIRQARGVERSLRVEPWLGDHHDRGDHHLVVLPTGELLALSLAGEPAQVMVSEGLMKALSPAQLEAVLTHEEAHLRHGHRRYLLLGTAVQQALGFLPFVRRSVAALRLAIERWADEEAAAAAPGGRAAVRQALGALATAAVAPGVAAFGWADTVLERVRALACPEGPEEGQGVLAYGPVVALGLAVLAFWGVWLGAAGSALAAGPLCLV
ncbi:MAG: M56 family metallopeptidase [Actinomycetota bacterium]|nr:M56 family metallopeptidase [Actinomycetota bacterium]